MASHLADREDIPPANPGECRGAAVEKLLVETYRDIGYLPIGIRRIITETPAMRNIRGNQNQVARPKEDPGHR